MTHLFISTKTGSEAVFIQSEVTGSLTIVTTTHHINIQLSARAIGNQVALNERVRAAKGKG